MSKINLIPWNQENKIAWFKEQKIQRSYLKDVVSKIEKLHDLFEICTYGNLSYDLHQYSLYLLKSKLFDPTKKTILITGGVHGYETSGVHGALTFMGREAQRYSHLFNIVCAPCVSPWSYETINRWNPNAIDPNRSFYKNSPAEECRFFMEAISQFQFYAHFDLHETTDTDNTIFRPAKEKRDGQVEEFSVIPDGFYLVGNLSNLQLEFQKAIIDSVRMVTHIAPADENGKILGVDIQDEGIIFYDMNKLFLCGGVTNADYSTTTEVYPDGPMVTDDICIDAQVASICGGLDFLASKTIQ
jgi:hypothetical protein